MTEVERESMEVDVLYVGAGPANLASAYHLMKQVEAYNAKAEAGGGDPIEPPTVLIIDKAPRFVSPRSALPAFSRPARKARARHAMSLEEREAPPNAVACQIALSKRGLDLRSNVTPVRAWSRARTMMRFVS